jgi:hypothetical protein
VPGAKAKFLEVDARFGADNAAAFADHATLRA